LTNALNSGTAKVEDRFEGTTLVDLNVGGRTVIPRARPCAASSPQWTPPRDQPHAKMTVSFDQVTVNGRAYPVRGTVTQAIEVKVSKARRQDRDRRGVGAILGGVLGGVKGRDPRDRHRRRRHHGGDRRQAGRVAAGIRAALRARFAGSDPDKRRGTISHEGARRIGHKEHKGFFKSQRSTKNFLGDSLWQKNLRALCG